MVNGAEQDSWGAYGAMKQQQLEAPQAGGIVKPPSHGRQRMRMNLVAIVVSFFFPWLLFTALYALLSFRIHYNTPQLCWGIVGLAILLVLCMGLLTVVNVLQYFGRSPLYVHTWLGFLFLTSLVAVVTGSALGNANFHDNMQTYYDLENLNDYTGVDPLRMRGQQMMDAGRVQFAPGTSLDLTKAFAFQNQDTYCVAPITSTNPAMGQATPLGVYDFWAVGINCCGGNSTRVVDFKCGAYMSDGAHEGLRFMQGTSRSFDGDEERGFFRLAVQQAEAAHNIKALHPLFFHWTDNAVTKMHTYLEMGFKNIAISMCVFFVCQLVFVFLTSYVLSLSGGSCPAPSTSVYGVSRPVASLSSQQQGSGMAFRNHNPPRAF